MMGIYCYEDTLNNNEIVYIGKDSNINRTSRHIAHTSPSRYNEQHINRVLQNNPKRYMYKVLKSWEKTKYPNQLTNLLEMLYIRRYAPKFNFTKGGEGLTGVKHTDETKNKISQTKKENLDKISGENNPRYNTNVPSPLDLLDEYENGNLTQSKLAEKYNVSRGTIDYRIHKALKLKGNTKNFRDRRSNPPIYQGKNHPQYNDNIPEPFDLLKEYEETGIGIIKLSEKYGCSKSTIHRRIDKARKMRL